MGLWNEQWKVWSPEERKRNPGPVRAVRIPDYPGFQRASAAAIETCTGSSTYFSTADWWSTNSGW